VSELRRRRVGEVKKKKKIWKRDTAGHRNLARRPRSGVQHVSDADTTPKMACPCNLGEDSQERDTLPHQLGKEKLKAKVAKVQVQGRGILEATSFFIYYYYFTF